VSGDVRRPAVGAALGLNRSASHGAVRVAGVLGMPCSPGASGWHLASSATSSLRARGRGGGALAARGGTARRCGRSPQTLGTLLIYVAACRLMGMTHSGFDRPLDGVRPFLAATRSRCSSRGLLPGAWRLVRR